MNKTNKNNQSILNILNQLEDYRRKQGQRHPLQVILLIIIMGIMSGSKSERAIARFAENNKESLIKESLIKELKIVREEVPSRKVLSKFIQKVDFNKLQNLFYLWTLSFVKIKKGEWLSIDGKALRGTKTNTGNKLQDFISLITIFVSKKKLALLAGKINTKKENEIPKVQELLKMLDLQGVNFTLDALHCQTKTVKTIIETKNNYVIGVKNNQRNLLKALKKTVIIEKV